MFLCNLITNQRLYYFRDLNKMFSATLKEDERVKMRIEIIKKHYIFLSTQWSLKSWFMVKYNNNNKRNTEILIKNEEDNYNGSILKTGWYHGLVVTWYRFWNNSMRELQSDLYCILCRHCSTDFPSIIILLQKPTAKNETSSITQSHIGFSKTINMLRIILFNI